MDDVEELWTAVRGLVPELRARALEAERLRTMPPDLAARAKRAGLLRLNLPRCLGGRELDPATTVGVVEELSRADGSAGWTILIGNSTAFFAWLDPAVAAEMIGDDRDFASTSMWAPEGRAVPRGDGAYDVAGRWPFNSGCSHAEWLQAGVFVMDGEAPRVRDGGAPDWRLAFVRREAAEIEDTWDAAGLRGTGSHHLSITGRRVPEEHLAAPFFEPARHDGPLWRIPFVTLAGITLAGFPLGVARRALDEITALAASKVRGPATATIAHDGDFQSQLARAEAGSRRPGRSSSTWWTRSGPPRAGATCRASRCGHGCCWRRTRRCVRASTWWTARTAWAGPARSTPTSRCSAASATSTRQTSTSCSAPPAIRRSRSCGWG
jgi:alkylation response protein AidB-like acyl-CoA dehydrogenase